MFRFFPAQCSEVIPDESLSSKMCLGKKPGSTACKSSTLTLVLSPQPYGKRFTKKDVLFAESCEMPPEYIRKQEKMETKL